MTATGLLFVTNPKRLVSDGLNVINKYVRKTLYVQLLPSTHCYPITSKSEDWKEKIGLQLPHLCRSIMKLYSKFSSCCPDLDTRVLLEPIKRSHVKNIITNRKVEVVIFDSGFKTQDIDGFVKSCVSNLSQEYKVILIPENNSVNNEDLQEDEEVFNTRSFDQIHDNVVLGGTFDRLHNGHKILLSEAILRCNQKLTIGVTDSSMVKNKLLCELIQPCEERIDLVRKFVEDMDSSITYEIVPIDDPFGPTKSDPTLQLIVVSGETYKGALKVNDVRKEKGLPTLNIHEIPLLPNDCKQSAEEEDKMSSSALRMHLLGTTLKKPEKQPRDPLSIDTEKVPYLLGLTGGIASGKSTVTNYLEKLGAGVINCDILGHKAYEKGQPCYHDLLKAFGSEIIDVNGQINRQALGKIVFDDQDKLKLLNTIVWPHILELLKKHIARMASGGQHIVVVEAAVLVKAKWHVHCNEVWACIIPQSEAIRRLQDRVKLDYHECEKRVLAQTPNSEAVAEANVVISTLWSREYTQKQVERGWKEMQCRAKYWSNSYVSPSSSL
ncbi:bifunctional coenzyme A synthase [Hetaerina americana]|uniref:bifunctional coenzyme A synthase n=1 Tax=Hetaerina americana TaxID=62018 RepID=UPI003A7F2F7B